MRRLFISSVQREFARERKLLKQYISKNPAYKRLFDAFVFEEDVVATDRSADEVYLDELAKCDVYIGLVGNDYGNEDANGVSPTEKEYDEATRLGLPRLMFVLGRDDGNRHPKEQAFLRKISDSLIRARCEDASTLLLEIYASLDGLLVEEGAFNVGPFDAAICNGASLTDIDEDKVRWFVKRARALRNADLDESMPVRDILVHLKLMASQNDVLTNAAILLFGKDPQRFHISSEIKCAQWYGAERKKPILSYQIYKGNLFDMADKAIAFVLSHLNRRVGTRENGAEAPREYDIPASVVSEAIINAIAHRDYASAASVQVELFSNRLVIRNPGAINPALDIEDLFKEHSSCPNNSLIADQLYQTKYIEKFGTGFTDLVNDCVQAGLGLPEMDMGHSGVTLTIHRNYDAGMSGTNNGQIRSNNGQIKFVTDAEIFALILKAPTLSIGAMAERLNMPSSTLRKRVDKFRAEGVLIREGARRKGRWLVTKNYAGCASDGTLLVGVDVPLSSDLATKVQEYADKRGIPLETAVYELVTQELHSSNGKD